MPPIRAAKQKSAINHLGNIGDLIFVWNNAGRRTWLMIATACQQTEERRRSSESRSRVRANEAANLSPLPLHCSAVASRKCDVKVYQQVRDDAD